MSNIERMCEITHICSQHDLVKILAHFQYEIVLALPHFGNILSIHYDPHLQKGDYQNQYALVKLQKYKFIISVMNTRLRGQKL